MKKITAIVALALLAIAGTGFAVTCAQDNVPAATLLVPYFKVGGTGVIGFNDIPDTSGTDTLVSVTNVSSTKLIIHVTVWNKYSAPVLDFNVPMTGYDVVFWSMRDILNGKLNVNPTFQKLTSSQDPCGQKYTTTPPGFDNTLGYLKFLPGAFDTDRQRAISVYSTPAFTGLFRQNVWTSLDESYDITNWLTPGSLGGGVLDNDNYTCLAQIEVNPATGTAVVGDFSGYVTIDVNNYCTQHFPTDLAYYANDAIATVGWGGYPGSNVLMGDVFYKDQAPGTSTGNMGNVSGDQTVAIEFDSRLLWSQQLVSNGSKTFYGRYYGADPMAAGYTFTGDGREPLGTNYGFRYVQTAAPTALRTWITVWRSDYYPADAPTETNLCAWWYGLGYGFTDTTHTISVNLWDNDEGQVVGSGGPSGGPPGGQLYIFLEAQRLVVTPNASVAPASFLGGWINLNLPGNFQEQAFVGVQHSALGLAMSVGHGATLLNGQFVCSPAPTVTYNGPLPSGVTQSGRAVQTALTY